MGLGDLTPDGTQSNSYRQYPDHEKQDELEQMVDEAEGLFPGGVEIEFIEVSPEMTRTQGYCYNREVGNYIRIAECVMENRPMWYVEMVVRHEMVHAWMDQNGYGDFSDGSKVFEWVCGRVGADITDTAPGHEEYEVIEQFL